MGPVNSRYDGFGSPGVGRVSQTQNGSSGFYDSCVDVSGARVTVIRE